MGEIYSNAEKVYAYPGYDLGPSVIGMDRVLQSPDEDKEPGLGTILGHLDMFCQPYWARLWIVQELRLAKDVSFWFSAQILKNRHVAKMADWLCDNEKDVRKAVGTTALHLGYQALAERFFETAAPRVQSLLGRSAPPRNADLRTVIDAYRHCICQDYRDKVFGLQALVDPLQRLTIDYSKDAEQMVYSAVEAFVIRAALADRLKDHEIQLWEYESDVKTNMVELSRRVLNEKPDKSFLRHGDLLAAKLASSMNTSLSTPYITKTLTWARLILDLPFVFGGFERSPNVYKKRRTYSRGNWEKVGHAALEFASTAMQIQFSEDLDNADIQFRTYVSEWDHRQRSSTYTQDSFIPVASRIIYEIAKKRKFVLFGSCLWHPTEYPGTGTPSSPSDYSSNGRSNTGGRGAGQDWHNGAPSWRDSMRR
jgi:hypothetical protein